MTEKYNTMRIIGIVREGKNPPDKRTPLTPDQCVELMEKFADVKVVVQSSPHRCFSDKDYSDAGIEVVEDIGVADIL